MDKDAVRRAASTHLRSTRVDYGSKGTVKRGRSLLSGVALATLIACLLMPLAGCGGEPSESLTESIIAFRRNDQIWTARGDGTEQKQLTDGFDASPAISPDGNTIVYEHSEGEPYRSFEYRKEPTTIYEAPPSVGIYVIPSGGGKPRLLTPESWLTSTGWKPLFGERFTDSWWIVRNCIEPSFSPDGKTICFIISDNAYARDPGPGLTREFLALATMNANGKGEPRILLTIDRGESYSTEITNPRFSPDGSEINVSYNDWSSSFKQIYRIPTTGGELAQVTPIESRSRDTSYDAFGISNLLGRIAAVQWSSGGGSARKSIVLMGMNAEDIIEIYSMPIELPIKREGGISSLPDIGNEPPSFTPDGELIGFATPDVDLGKEYGSRTPDIYVIPVEGGTPRKIISDGNQPCFGREVSR